MNVRETAGAVPVYSGSWQLWAMCRPGFEADCELELVHRLPGLHRCKTQKHASAGIVAWQLAQSGRNIEIDRLRQLLRREDAGGFAKGLIFSVDVVLGRAVCFPKGETDRAQLIVNAVSELATQVGVGENLAGVSLKVAESTNVPGLERFCRQFARPLERSLRNAGFIKPGAPARDESDEVLDGRSHKAGLVRELVVIFSDYENALLGIRDRSDASALMKRGRVPRLVKSPSRSGSKLSEAFRFFGIGKLERSGMERAVDLGAAPGGWSAVLAEHGFQVTAVDNGQMSPELIAGSKGQVTHVRSDAFHFPIDSKVQFLACDIVERPQQVTDLMIKWLRSPVRRTVVFNLKLPMKQRFGVVESCLGKIREELQAKGADFTLDAAQLYHDRQEVTVFVKRYN